MTLHQDMVYQLGGVPVGVGGRMITGKVFFVDSNLGNNSWSGKKPNRAFGTLDFALGKCTADKDDHIFVMPGHTETITGAGGITLDIAGVQVIGLGRYDARPRFLMDAGTAVTMLVTAANCSMENIVFAAGHADVVKFAHISAKGFRLHKCVIEENVANENFVRAITAGTADNDYDGLEISECDFRSPDGASVHAIELLKNSQDVKLIGNRIVGDYANTPYAPIYSPSAEIHTNIYIAHNKIHNQHDANAAVGISIANTASTGWIIYNLVGHQDAAGETPILAGAAGLFCAENYCAGVLGTASGYLYPAVDS